MPSAGRKPSITSSCQSSMGAASSQRFQVSRRRRRVIRSMTAARTTQRYTADSEGAGVTPLRASSTAIRRAPSRDGDAAYPAPWLRWSQSSGEGTAPLGANCPPDPPVRRTRTALANGASSVATRSSPPSPGSPSDRRQLPPGPLCTSVQSRSSPSWRECRISRSSGHKSPEGI